MNRLSIALLHHPVLSKEGEIYTTAITNIDVHDIARSSTTYGLSHYYLVSPITAQRELAQSIADFWVIGGGKLRNPDRTRAMELINVQSDLASLIKYEEELCGQRPLLIATSAQPFADKKPISYAQGRTLIKDHKSIVLLFGTGYGLAQSVLNEADYLLEAINGPTDYNHLSVRSAAAIILDRLLA